jgi:hypothetical protein
MGGGGLAFIMGPVAEVGFRKRQTGGRGEGGGEKVHQRAGKQLCFELTSHVPYYPQPERHGGVGGGGNKGALS